VHIAVGEVDKQRIRGSVVRVDDFGRFGCVLVSAVPAGALSTSENAIYIYVCDQESESVPLLLNKLRDYLITYS
jgi:hypothetical protein